MVSILRAPLIQEAMRFLFLVSCLLHFCYLVKSQDEYRYYNCDTSANYTSGSAYQLNLNLTLSSLATNASLTGYYVTATGQAPDVTYGLIQCRGYVSMEDCQTCANSVVSEIRQLCPTQKGASICIPNCSLQYSDLRFFSTVNSSPILGLMNLGNATDPVVFNNQLGNLLRNLSSNAAADPSRLAYGSTSYTDFRNIYAMTQCTRDITVNDCLSCLQNIISFIPNLMNNRVGGRIFAMSCYLRFEIYSFYALPSPPPSPLLQPSSTSHNGNSSNKIVVVVASVAAALVLILIIGGCVVWKKAKRKQIVYDHTDIVNEDGNTNMESLLIGLNTLKVATASFALANKLGEGGFGPVYKGKLRDGREIAVKRLSSSSRQGVEELKTEVMLVAKLMHRNLVRLLGFCLEEEEKLLVYEYLPNGSLDKVLFDQNRRFSLEWERRYKIIVGIARGLVYLHHDSQLRIIHRDLKASNILLDQSMNPKISDFGLARLFPGSETQANTNRIAGTYGYMAPEYAKKGQFSTKSDVYSFGVLVLEIVTGQKNSSFRNFMNLQSYAWDHWANGTAMELLDPTLVDQCQSNEVLKCIHIGLLCVQESPSDRPTMSEIVMMLSSYNVTSPEPLRPAFFISKEGSGSDLTINDSATSQLQVSRRDSQQQSINEVSITELEPR